MIYSEGNKDIPEKLKLGPEDRLELRSGWYTVVKEVGKGGFAHVYAIRNASEQLFALKVMDLWMIRPDEYEFLECKFRQEFETGRIQCAQLVQSYHGGHIEGNPYIIMDYCPNGTLASRMTSFTEEPAYRRLASAILTGLQALHQHGVIHRDLKPENVLFDEHDLPKLTDFGIAGHLNKRLTSRNFIGMVSQVWGSPLYAPPEQLDHSKAFRLTAPSMDIFSFGVVMYEVISGGRHPFGNHKELLDDPKKFTDRVKTKSYEPLIPTRQHHGVIWNTIIDRCLAPNPKDRFTSVDEILKLVSGNPGHYGFSPSVSSSGNSRVCLKIIQGEEIGHLYMLESLCQNGDDTDLTIGWKDDTGAVTNAIPIKETRTNYISRRHATLSRKQGQWLIKDGQATGDKNDYRYSLNGTYVNYKTLEGNIPATLKNGDIITIGDTILKFQIV